MNANAVSIVSQPQAAELQEVVRRDHHCAPSENKEAEEGDARPHQTTPTHIRTISDSTTAYLDDAATSEVDDDEEEVDHHGANPTPRVNDGWVYYRHNPYKELPSSTRHTEVVDEPSAPPPPQQQQQDVVVPLATNATDDGPHHATGVRYRHNPYTPPVTRPNPKKAGLEAAAPLGSVPKQRPPPSHTSPPPPSALAVHTFLRATPCQYVAWPSPTVASMEVDVAIAAAVAAEGPSCPSSRRPLVLTQVKFELEESQVRWLLYRLTSGVAVVMPGDIRRHPMGFIVEVDVFWAAAAAAKARGAPPSRWPSRLESGGRPPEWMVETVLQEACRGGRLTAGGVLCDMNGVWAAWDDGPSHRGLIGYLHKRMFRQRARKLPRELMRLHRYHPDDL